MGRPLYHVIKAKPLDGYRLRLTFEDQTAGTVDLSDIVVRGGVFRPLKDPDYFWQVRVDLEAGTVVWPNEVDVAPEELYARAHRQSASHEVRPPSARMAASGRRETPRRSRLTRGSRTA